ncbi:PrsW family glutamic-type intramembrane protease [Actinopolymorpha pittospori]|uniref:RsiW-degrading membrane proteinase PrsW (M82 family) n=1 Tax=Actinopolymorpha pittospori TaxID=648752 RepID=A0A927MWD5_9ACTN|nr:RsiW-degrading membrane proteinase PrsW (M82 family) [Actinopolymorpha pittospori]
MEDNTEVGDVLWLQSAQRPSAVLLRIGGVFGLAFAAVVAVLVTALYEPVRMPLPPVPGRDADLDGSLFLAIVIGVWLVCQVLGVAVLALGVRTGERVRVLVAIAWLAWSSAVGVMELGWVLREGFRRGTAISEAPEIPVLNGLLLLAAGLSLVLLLGFSLCLLLCRNPARRSNLRRYRRAMVAVALLSPFTILAGGILLPNLGVFVWCLPTTLFGLGVVYFLQRHRRMPFRVLLVAAGLGGLIAPGFAVVVNFHVATHAQVFLPTSGHFIALLSVVSSVGEEGVKAVVVALVYVFSRRWFDGVVPGLVVGAATGLGFNLVESVQYMAAGGGDTAMFHHWLRQGVGLMGGHLAFTALTGAGIGVASQLSGASRKTVAVVSGLLPAICAHFASNYVLITGVHNQLLPDASPALQTMVVLPTLMILLQGPFALLCVLVLRRGLREQAEMVAAGLRAETAKESGAVTSLEVAILSSPPHRFRMNIDALRGGGVAAYRMLRRLQRTQLELAMAHVEQSANEVETLRRRVLEMKETMLHTFATETEGAIA